MEPIIKAGTGNRTSNKMNEIHELTTGMKAVGLDFNPSGKTEVIRIKQTIAGYIDYLNKLRTDSDNTEVKRQLSIAITEAQTSQMWAVKAVTWVY